MIVTHPVLPARVDFINQHTHAGKVSKPTEAVANATAVLTAEGDVRRGPRGSCGIEPLSGTVGQGERCSA